MMRDSHTRPMPSPPPLPLANVFDAANSSESSAPQIVLVHLNPFIAVPMANAVLVTETHSPAPLGYEGATGTSILEGHSPTPCTRPKPTRLYAA